MSNLLDFHENTFMWCLGAKISENRTGQRWKVLWVSTGKTGKYFAILTGDTEEEYVICHEVVTHIPKIRPAQCGIPS